MESTLPYNRKQPDFSFDIYSMMCYTSGMILKTNSDRSLVIRASRDELLAMAAELINLAKTAKKGRGSPLTIMSEKNLSGASEFTRDLEGIQFGRI